MNNKWATLVLSGKKIWEIRTRNTNIRERIALGNTKTKCYVGYATIVDSVEMTVAEIFKHNNKHQANDFIKQYAKGRETLFIWVLKDVVVEHEPKPYSYSTGSWCRTS
ncbi:ASCH domain-containing protein [Candidatus Bathyarchaeota archaeon]|nr:ASCH domain-containing protein [Candidatus Bathyarchaeota archaeon]